MLKPSLKSVLALGICLAPSVTYAQDAFDIGDAPATPSSAAAATYSNEVTIGGTWQSGDSALFGRYNGSPDAGLHPNVSGILRGRDAWDSGDTFYYELLLNDLTLNSKHALPDSSVSLKFGKQGSWAASLYFDNMTYTQSLKFNSPYSASMPGTLVIGAAGGISLTGISLTNPPNATDIAISNSVAAILNTQRVGTQRNSFGFSLTDLLSEGWSLTGSYAHEHKDGTKENSVLQGSGTGVNSASGNIVYFAEPVDYDTDRFTTVLAYTSPDLQAQVTNILSSFTDNRLNTVLQDPFATTNVKSVPLSATYAAPPSSLSEQIKGQFAYNFSPTTRLAASVAYGLQFQDADYSVQSTNTTAIIPLGSGTSYNGKVQTLFGSATLTSRPLTDLDLRASYTINSRQNQSPRKTFSSLLNDTSSFGGITTNAPYSYQYQKANAEAGYSLMPETRMIAGYTFEQKMRTYSAVDRNNESTVYARINSQLLDDFGATFGFSNSVRASGTYNGDAPWVALGFSQATQVDNLGMKHYSEAPRTRTEYRGEASWVPQNDLSMSVTGRYYKDNYSQTLYGITQDHGLEISPDLAYEPTKDISAHLFYTYEQIYYELSDRVTPGGGGAIFYWTLGTPNTVHTVGVSGDWQATDDLKLSGSYVYQHGITAFNEVGTPSGSLGTSPWNFNVVSLPSNTTVVNSLNLQGEYQWNATTSVVLGYLYERLDSTDYVNSQLPTSPLYSNAILGGDGNPSYNIHAVRVAARFKF